MTKRDLVLVSALIGATVAARVEYHRAHKRYERMMLVSSSRMKLMLDLNARLQHLRRQRERTIDLHGVSADGTCRACGNSHPCETLRLITDPEPTP